MKLPLMAALAALTLWGCSSQSANTRTDDSATGGSGMSRASEDAAREQAESRNEAEESPGEAADVVDNERRDREGAPTVYDGEATGGSGTDTTVTTPDGEKWDVQEEPNLDGEPNDTNREAGTGGSGEGNDLGGGVSGESEPDSATEEVDGSR
ncbi:hypothetical protein [Pyxidicoccus trucidator]|uniref:hypothetical protein n=1 Tax=Pyxidicoccus trucidator TaxID=2709662 RepID=UPI0013DD0209|nr:hypothetical protein [Pyxidicoccus trucidator]